MNINNAYQSKAWESSGSRPHMSPSTRMSNLFDSIDTSASGAISKSQFEQAFDSLKLPPVLKAAGADAVWAKLDPNGNGQVSKKDFTDTMVAQLKALRGNHHHHNDANENGSSQNQPGGSPSSSGARLNVLA